MTSDHRGAALSPPEGAGSVSPGVSSPQWHRARKALRPRRRRGLRPAPGGPGPDLLSPANPAAPTGADSSDGPPVLQPVSWDFAQGEVTGTRLGDTGGRT